MSNSKAKVISFMNEFWNEKCIKAAEEMHQDLFSEKVLIHSPLGKNVGSHSLEKINMHWSNAFPNMQIENINITDNNNLVTTEWESHGVHEGQFKDLNPTQKTIKYKGATIFQFENNKVVNYICYIDIVNIYHQLGFFLKEEEYSGQHIISKNHSMLFDTLKTLTSEQSFMTQKEVDILSCWIMGRCPKEIGLIMNVSHRTVEKHIENIKYKFSLNSKYSILSHIASKNMYHIIKDLYLLLLQNRSSILLNNE